MIQSTFGLETGTGSGVRFVVILDDLVRKGVNYWRTVIIR